MRRAVVLALILVVAGAARAEDNGPFDVRHYDLRVALDWEARSIVGEETIRVVVRRAGRELAFSDNALEIVSASVDGRDVAVRRDARRMIFVLPRDARAGSRMILKIAYRGTPRRGLIFESGLAYASYFACDWMICDQDRPGDKATFAIRAPGERIVPSGAVRQAHGAYLFGFVAGRFDEVTLPGFRHMRALSARRRGGELAATFAATPLMAAFFEGKAGLPLSPGHWQLLTRAPEAQEGAASRSSAKPSRPRPPTRRRTGRSPTSWRTSGGAIWSPARPGATSGSTRASRPS